MRFKGDGGEGVGNYNAFCSVKGRREKNSMSWNCSQAIKQSTVFNPHSRYCNWFWVAEQEKEPAAFGILFVVVIFGPKIMAFMATFIQNEGQFLIIPCLCFFFSLYPSSWALLWVLCCLPCWWQTMKIKIWLVTICNGCSIMWLA